MPGCAPSPPTIERGIKLPLSTGFFRFTSGKTLALKPVMPGFVINSLVYAMLAFGILTVVRRIRQHMRVRSGCCVKCRYDLSGADHLHCPECGLVTHVVTEIVE